MEEKKKSKKPLIITIIVIAILLIGVGGYLVYNSYFKEEPKEAAVVEPKENTDFYAVENLVKNKYIEKKALTEDCAQDCNQEMEEVTIKIENGKVYLKDKNNFDAQKYVEAKGIEGTPKYVSCTNYLSMDSISYLVLSEEGDLFYASIEEDNFTKINTEKVVNIYDFVNLDATDFPLNFSFPEELKTLYVETENGDLLKVADGKITTSFKENWPYPDLIYSPTVGGFINGLLISPDKELYSLFSNNNSNKAYIIKYKGEPIIVKEGFSTMDNQKLEEETYDATNYYVISTDNKLYKVVVANTEEKEMKVELYTEKEVQNYDFVEATSDEMIISTVKITYKDGTTESIKDIIGISTLHYRYNK